MLFYFFSKFLWLLFRPSHFILLIYLLSFLIRKNILGIFLRWSSLILLLFFSFVPIGYYFTNRLEQMYPQLISLPDKVSGIVVLGGDFNIKTAQSRSKKGFAVSSPRTFSAYLLARQFPGSIVIYSDGSKGNYLKTAEGSSKYITNAELATSFLKEQLGSKNIIIAENSSKNTFENAVQVSKLLKKYNYKDDENWLLVTSASHMPRSMYSFSRMGIHLVPYAVDYKTKKDPNLFDMLTPIISSLSLLDNSVHEYLGLLVYWLTD